MSEKDSKKSIFNEEDQEEIQEELLRKIVLLTPKKQKWSTNLVPFHIAHKKLLEKIENNKIPGEPLVIISITNM